MILVMLLDEGFSLISSRGREETFIFEWFGNEIRVFSVVITVPGIVIVKEFYLVKVGVIAFLGVLTLADVTFLTYDPDADSVC